MRHTLPGRRGKIALRLPVVVGCYVDKHEHCRSSGGGFVHVRDRWHCFQRMVATISRYLVTHVGPRPRDSRARLVLFLGGSTAAGLAVSKCRRVYTIGK